MANINIAHTHIKVLAINPHDKTIEVIFLPACYDEEDGCMVITPSSAKDAMNTKQMLVHTRTTIGLLRVELIGEDNSYGYLWPGITMGGAIFRGMLLIVKNRVFLWMMETLNNCAKPFSGEGRYIGHWAYRPSPFDNNTGTNYVVRLLVELGRWGRNKLWKGAGEAILSSAPHLTLNSNNPNVWPPCLRSIGLQLGKHMRTRVHA